MRRTIFLCLLCIAVSCVAAGPLHAQVASPQQPATQAGCTGCPRPSTPDTDVHDVSIIQLVARPEQFHGRRVRVTGYLWLEFEGNGIYLSESDRTHGVYRNGLWVSFAPGVLDGRQEYSGRYVLVEGTFNAEDRGHMGLWSGAIQQITRALPRD
ncbi:MAG: hypothetical protein KY444_02775 [Gemmatimonadetes bacterium]|nr:hypothetical protein [Gemmatimonadota bacterium]